ncbi:TRAP transporter TatT component family protein [Halobacteriovorax sp. DA5]|uniref:TRAP transporter TatT component family protein n=1 Tax=Halobacteriovorax sp. DA5 TaxID=2067553 RepID=UPI001304960E|nr:TRAP transporter TatT component family protein [Halobacteriovorax sp. DA5]
MATNQMGDMIFETSEAVFTEDNWDLFESTIDSNIKLVENLYAADRENPEFIVTLIKAYSGKAFAIDETYYLKDQLKELSNSKYRVNALSNYTRALNYSALFFEVRGFKDFDFTRYISSPEDFKKLLDENLSDNATNIEGVFYTGQTLASIINLQRDNMRAVAYLPLAKVMYDWSCEKNGNLAQGACDIFNASYAASRPRGLGGDPVTGKRLFEEAIQKWPNNMLVRLSFIQFYAVPMFEENIYRNQKLEMNKFHREQMELTYWSGGKIETPKVDYNNLFNLIARKRLKIIEGLEEEIF